MRYVVTGLIIIIASILVARACSRETSIRGEPSEQGTPDIEDALPRRAYEDVRRKRPLDEPRPTLGDAELKVRPEPQQPTEGIGAYRFRVQWVEAYNAFLADAGYISPEREQEILRIFADAQQNFIAVGKEADELRWNATMRPSPENERKYQEFLDSGLWLYIDIHDECHERLRALLNEREWKSYVKHLWPNEIYWALQHGHPIS